MYYYSLRLVYRRNFLEPENIAILPPKGYSCGDTQSQGAQQWLRYVSETEGIYIQHAKNEGERHIGKYKLSRPRPTNKKVFSHTSGLIA